MKILIVNNLVRHGGGTDTSVALECRALTARGHEVRLFSRDNRTLDEARGAVRLGLLASSLYSFPVRRDLGALFRRERFDVVLVENTVPLLTGAVFDACRHANVLTVQRLRNFRAYCLSSYAYRAGASCDSCARTLFVACTRFRCYHGSYLHSAALTAARWVDCLHRRPAGSAADAYLANSEFTRRRHVEHGFPSERVMVVPNSADDLATLIDARSRPNVLKKLTFTGSLLREKGVWSLLDLAEALPDFELHVIGSGREEAALRGSAARRRLSNVIFHGQQPGADKARLWADSLLTLVPSLWEESFGLVVAESYSLGIPVITSGRGGMAETVRHGETGFVADFADAEAIAALVRRVWDDPNRHRSLGRATREDYERTYTVEVLGERLEVALRSALDTRATRRPVRPQPLRSPWRTAATGSPA